MKPKVSVIVPVYNIEKYLTECLDSIAAQTLDGIQVLLIDDGSKDTSGEICKEYIKTHNNFEYYHKENGGTASARNMGLAHARGEYLGFVDSDDWIEPNMFEVMYRTAKEADADILYCKMYGLEDYVDIPDGIYDETRIHNELFPFILPHVTESGTFRTVDWGNCSRLYRSSIIHENGIRFYEKSRRCEDFAFSVECALHAKCYVVIGEGELYHYRPNENSKSRSYTKNMWKSIQSLMTYMIEMTRQYRKYDFSTAIQFCVFYFCTYAIRNEMRAGSNGQCIEKMREIITDPLCVNAVNSISTAGMNQEYTALHGYMKDRDAKGLKRYLKQLAWKKKYLIPMLESVLNNQVIKRLYQKIRGR